MHTNKPNILITDSREKRLEKLIEVFSPICCVYTYSFDIGEIEYESQKITDGEVPDFLVYLIHGRDDDLKDIAAFEHRVWYGGYGFDDNRILENEPVITTQIRTDRPLKPKEAALLIGYFQNKNAAPYFLKITTESDILTKDRAKFINTLYTPEHIDWEKINPDHLFKDFNKEWTQFFQASKRLLKTYPDFSSSHEDYEQYAVLIDDLYKQTIEKTY